MSNQPTAFNIVAAATEGLRESRGSTGPNMNSSALMAAFGQQFGGTAATARYDRDESRKLLQAGATQLTKNAAELREEMPFYLYAAAEVRKLTEGPLARARQVLFEQLQEAGLITMPSPEAESAEDPAAESAAEAAVAAEEPPTTYGLFELACVHASLITAVRPGDAVYAQLRAQYDALATKPAVPSDDECMRRYQGLVRSGELDPEQGPLTDYAAQTLCQLQDVAAASQAVQHFQMAAEILTTLQDASASDQQRQACLQTLGASPDLATLVSPWLPPQLRPHMSQLPLLGQSFASMVARRS